MKTILKNPTRQSNKITKEQTLTNIISANVLVCIINNPGIDALKIAKKTRIPQASVYRSLFSLNKTDFLDTMKRKPGRNRGNSTIMFASKKKRFRIVIDSNGIHVD